MAILEIIKNIKIENNFIIQNCLKLCIVSITAWVSKQIIKKSLNDSDQISERRDVIPLIIVTGCDSGLGYSIVMRYLNDEYQNNKKKYNWSFFNYNKFMIPDRMAIVAFCLKPDGPGAKCLLQESLKNSKINLFIRQLDLTDTDSIVKGVNFVKNLCNQNLMENDTYNETYSSKYKLHALVNNAARMVMAEYEWQTPQMIQEQLEVNFLGPVTLTSQLLPKFRKDKSRVINVISHCAYLPLPGISLYGATKAAMRAWTISSRIELENHGVKMITFLPGSFYLYSSIMNSQQRTTDYNKMSERMNNEQINYYGTYFDTYQNYLSSIEAFINTPETTIPSTSKIYYQMDNALWTVHPKYEYNVSEPWRYKVYYVIVWVLSVFGLHSLKDKAIRNFVATPKFQKPIAVNQKNS